MKKLTDLGFKTKNKTYIIAEIGINHGGDIELAKKMIDSAVRAGVDAVKFQTYITEKRTPKDSPIFGILKKCELSFDDFKELKKYASQCHVDFFSTPFDKESLDFLESINCDLYKVASFDVVNHIFLKQIAQTGKPIILSVGMSDLKEIATALTILKEKTNKIALLHCISAYPTNENDANLSAIKSLESNFDCIIGQSDHTNDIAVPLYAVAAGAQILEKHFKIDDTMECADAPVSITEKQMKELVIQTRRLEKILGHGNVELTEAQKPIEIYRRFSK